MILNCLKSRVAEHLWRVNMLKGPKVSLNLHNSTFVTFFDHSKKNQLKKLCFSSIWNLEIVS